MDEVAEGVKHSVTCDDLFAGTDATWFMAQSRVSPEVDSPQECGDTPAHRAPQQARSGYGIEPGCGRSVRRGPALSDRQ